jgi:ATP-binding cassette subfamily G (WHITE) protein 2 (SNQ2)
MYAERAEGREGTPIPLHNDNYRPETNRSGDPDRSSTEVETEHDGTWGERDEGVDCRVAMQEYEDLRTELSRISRTRTQSIGRRQSTGLKKTYTGASRRSKATTGAADVEAQDEEKEREEQEEEFPLGDFLRDGHFEKRNTKGSAKKVGVVYKNLTVQGLGATSTFVKTLPSAVLGVRTFICHSNARANVCCRLLALIYIDCCRGSFLRYPSPVVML